MFLLFKTIGRPIELPHELSGLEIVKTLRRAKELGLINYFSLYQFLLNKIMGKSYCIYVIVKNTECVHYSHVIGKRMQFPFIEENDIQIGPCWTRPDFRNQGIYTSMIKKILYDFAGHNAWMICDESNLASQRGIQKAGLKLVAKARHTRPLGIRVLGRYVIANQMESGMPRESMRARLIQPDAGLTVAGCSQGKRAASCCCPWEPDR